MFCIVLYGCGEILQTVNDAEGRCGGQEERGGRKRVVEGGSGVVSKFRVEMPTKHTK